MTEKAAIAARLPPPHGPASAQLGSAQVAIARARSFWLARALAFARRPAWAGLPVWSGGAPLRWRLGGAAAALLRDSEVAAAWLSRGGDLRCASPGLAALLGATPRDLGWLGQAEGAVRVARAAGQALSLDCVVTTAPAAAPLGVRLLPGGLLLVTDQGKLQALQARLSQAQALQDVGRLAGGIAHDFNNLLTAILGAVDELDGEPGSAAQACVIRDSAMRGAELVRQILAFGRQQTLQPRNFAVNDALRRLEGLLTRLLGRAIQVELALEQPGRSVLMDPTQFDRVIVNLAANARDAMPAGGVLRLATSRRLVLQPEQDGNETVPPGRYVCIEVRDTGCGIPPEVLPRIFAPFFTTRRESGGNGLGLATVYGIVRQSGGFLTVTSAPGQGAVFRITLPAVRDAARDAAGGRPGAAAQALAPAPAPAPASGPASAPGSAAAGAAAAAGTQAGAAARGLAVSAVSRTLLLVDDEAPVRLVCARALRRAGWTVREAACGEAALEDLRDGGAADLACVVSDVMMPGMDGTELVRQLRVVRPGLPAVLVSGYADAGQRQALAADDIRFLAKPFTPAELAAAVAAAVGERAASHQGVVSPDTPGHFRPPPSPGAEKRTCGSSEQNVNE